RRKAASLTVISRRLVNESAGRGEGLSVSKARWLASTGTIPQRPEAAGIPLVLTPPSCGLSDINQHWDYLRTCCVRATTQLSPAGRGERYWRRRWLTVPL